MNRQTLKRLMVKGTMAYVAVFSLVLMVAMPALAVLAANSIGSREIKDRSIKSRDIGKYAVGNGKIAPRSIRRGKIAENAINGSHIKSGSVKSSDIGYGQVKSSDIANRSIVNADIAWGAAISDVKIDFTIKNRYFTIPGSEFRPRVSSTQYAIDANTGFIFKPFLQGVDDWYFFAPVRLPQGAIVTQFRLNSWDSTDVDDVEALLRRISDSGDPTDMAFVDSNNDIDGYINIDDNLIFEPVIDNVNYTYFVRIKLSGAGGFDLRVLNARIKYTYRI